MFLVQVPPQIPPPLIAAGAIPYRTRKSFADLSRARGNQAVHDVLIVRVLPFDVVLQIISIPRSKLVRAAMPQRK